MMSPRQFATRLRGGSATRTPSFPVGVLQADIRNLNKDYEYGIRIALMELEWAKWEPVEGQFDESYMMQQISKAFVYIARGYKVGIVSGIHRPPAWLLAKPNIQHKDQWGNESGIANFQFSSVARDYGAIFLTSVVKAFGEYVWFHRVGLSKIGECLYPEAANQNSFPVGQRENNWWCFDTQAQSGTGLPAGTGGSPLPGWIPGTANYLGQPVTNMQVQSFYEWYFGANTNAHNWMLATIRAAGYGGIVHYVTPGMGCLPKEHDERLADKLAPIAGDDYYVMNTAAVWWRFYNELVDKGNCWMNASSIYDISGSPRGNITQPGDDAVNYDNPDIYNWSSARFLSSIARRHGMEVVGENPGQNSFEDAKKVISISQGCGLAALLWAFDDQLHSGNPEYCSLEQLSTLIR